MEEKPKEKTSSNEKSDEDRNCIDTILINKKNEYTSSRA